MPLEELLQRLVKGTPGKNYFLSAYLDLRPDTSGKKNYPVFLKSRISELASHFPAHSREQIFFVKDSKQIQKYLEEKLDPSWKGIAFFACAPDDLFLSVPMPAPPANMLEIASCPLLSPLLRYSDLYKTYGVVVANSRQARLFLVRFSRVGKQLVFSWEDSHSTRFGRMGLSTQRFQRHQKEHIKQRAKEIVENMEKWLNQERAEYLFFAAEEEMSRELEKYWSAVTRKKLVGLPSVDTRDPDHKILADAAHLLKTITREECKILAKKILEEAAPLGQGTVGPEPTLNALQNHQAERIVLDSHFQSSGWACEGCASLGSGGTPAHCPLCAGRIRSLDLHEEIVCRAKSQGLPLFFTHNFSPLLKAGGVAALLKYKTKRIK
jgi:hypothetical protein